MEPPVPAREQLGEKYYIVPYVPVSRGALNMIIAGVFCLVVIALGGLTVSIMGFHDLFHVSIVMLAVLSAAGLAFFLLQERLREGISILISDEGINFPYSFGPDLLYRRRRTWDDVATVTLGLLGAMKHKQFYENDLEETKNTNLMVIHFRSGGHATIDLSRLSQKGRRHLMFNIDDKIIDYSRSPLPRASDSNDFIAPKALPEVEVKDKSFTELWEEDMQDQFSATNFVPLEKGAFVKDRSFRVIMQLASGGLSAVYLAETPEKDLRVLKEAAVPLAMDRVLREKAKELFLREALILQKLAHPQIAHVYDYFVENGRDYLVLEFVPGHSLRQIVRQSGPIDEKKVLEYGRQLSEIIEYLHDHEPPIIHRDITPDNIVLREDGKIVLIDFGAANQILGTATGTLIGKQAYIAPEQFRGKAEPRSDVYAAGGTFYFLLTGKDPEALSASNPKEANSRVSPGVDELVCDCTQPEVGRRLRSAGLLHDRIENLIENGGGSVIDLKGAAGGTDGAGTIDGT